MITVLASPISATVITIPAPITTLGMPGVQGPPGDAVEIALARRHDWSPPYSYCGKATGEPLDSDPVWTIARIEIALDGTTTTTQAIDVAWDDRLTATYG